MQENFDINKAVKETSEFVRDKADMTMYSITKTAGDILAKTIIKLVSVVLGILVFLFANVALGLAIGKWLQISSFYGLLILASGYFVILLLVLIFSPLIKLMIRNIVAKKAVNKILELNETLDTKAPDVLRRNTKYRVKKKITYKDLVDMQEAAIEKSDNGLKQLKGNIAYIKANFKSILFDIAKAKTIVALYKNKYIGMVLNAFGIEPDNGNVRDKSSNNRNRIQSGVVSEKKLNSSGKKWLSLAATVGSSVLWSLLLSRTKKALIGKLIPFKKKSKKKRSLF